MVQLLVQGSLLRILNNRLLAYTFAMKFRNDHTDLLDKDISNLPVSADFIAQCKLMGYNTLKDIVNKGWIALMQERGFNFRWLAELMVLLENNQLVYQLQAMPDISR